MRARAYDPALGRFLSADPIGVGGGINLYAYAGGDPVNLVDPGGLEPNDLFSDDKCNVCNGVADLGGATITAPQDRTNNGYGPVDAASLQLGGGEGHFGHYDRSFQYYLETIGREGQRGPQIQQGKIDPPEKSKPPYCSGTTYRIAEALGGVASGLKSVGGGTVVAGGLLVVTGVGSGAGVGVAAIGGPIYAGGGLISLASDSLKYLAGDTSAFSGVAQAVASVALPEASPLGDIAMDIGTDQTMKAFVKSPCDD